MRLKKLVLLLAAPMLIVAAVNAGGGEMRTWTSSSGTTIEAAFQGMDGGRIMLRSADGRTLGIRPEGLSAADREYVLEKLGANGGGGPRITATDDIPIDSLPKIDKQSPRHVSYAALQYGGRPEDVAIFIFDREEGEEVNNLLYVYAPGTREYGSPVKMTGGRRTVDGHRTRRFRNIQFTGEYPGGLRATHDIEFYYGPLRTTLLFVLVETELTRGNERSTHVLGGCLNETFASFNQGVITPIPLIGEPRLRLGYRGDGRHKPQVHGRVQMSHSDLSVVPKRSMDSYARITVFDEDGEQVDNTRISWEEEDLLKAINSLQRRIPLDRMRRMDRSNAKFTIVGEIDLGPFLGKLKADRDVTY